MSMKDGLNVKDEKIYSFLMIGQSNMAGRGDFADVPLIKNSGCYMLRCGRWQTMYEPVNPDRCVFVEQTAFHSGVSLAPAFADLMAREEGVRVGLIPCADGGTHLNQWMPGQVLYDHAVLMAKLAMRSSTLAGILWHQGEADARCDGDVATYKERFIKMITAMREELGDVPVILGEIAKNTHEKWLIGERGPRLNKIFHEIAEQLPSCAVASSDGLVLKADGIHFNSESLRILGGRYYDCYKTIKKRTEK